MKLVPVNRKQARQFIAAHHRHSQPHWVAIMQVGLADDDGRLIGVAVAGRPCTQALCDGETVEVTRLCTTGGRNACSVLYGAITRAAKALGYRRAYTYTLQSESGSSLKATGWKIDGKLDRVRTWNVGKRQRHQSGMPLFGEPSAYSGEPRLRWRKDL
ncbi:XF1762 family protein [Candidatus Poriferisocius sp.]|uniref:XF1762 family protein n=1 Tax=Candidatus Poriferisocius sp. TaxID=3101276 RepID=UPI003B023803